MKYPSFELTEAYRRGRWQVLTIVILLCVMVGMLGMSPSLEAQPPSTTPTTDPAPRPPADDPFKELTSEAGECPPPSTQERILIGLGALVWAVIIFLLLVRLMERRFIQSDRSATLGRHAGISLTIFVSSLGLAAIGYLVTGCFHSELFLWLGFCGVIWLIHGIYTLIVARGE